MDLDIFVLLSQEKGAWGEVKGHLWQLMKDEV